LAVGIPLPGIDSLNTTKLVVPGKVPSGLGGRVTWFHAKLAEGGDVVVVYKTGAALKSEVPSRDASRSPSRPAVAPVERVKLKLMAVNGVENAVTDAGSTLPLTEETAAPK
jgi:hypothetical protein